MKLTTHVRTVRGRCTTYVGYIKAGDARGTHWTESTSIHRLTKMDAKADAETLKEQYVALSQGA